MEGACRREVSGRVAMQCPFVMYYKHIFGFFLIRFAQRKYWSVQYSYHNSKLNFGFWILFYSKTKKNLDQVIKTFRENTFYFINLYCLSNITQRMFRIIYILLCDLSFKWSTTASSSLSSPSSYKKCSYKKYESGQCLEEQRNKLLRLKIPSRLTETTRDQNKILR